MLSFSNFKKPFHIPCFTNSLTTLSVSSNNPGLRFCLWIALKFDSLKNEPYYSVTRVLSHNNCHSFYWDALHLLKDKGILITSGSIRALIRFYSHSGHTENAINAFAKMREFGVKPDAHTYNTILRDVLRQKLFVLSLALYNTMLKSNCVPNEHTYNMLIDGFCKSGNIKGAREVLDEMQKVGFVPDAISSNSILYGLCQTQNVDEAHSLFSLMKENGCSPDLISCNTLLHGFCKLGRLDDAVSFLRFIKQDGFSLDLIGYCSLIHSFFRARRYGEALAWYAGMFKAGFKPDGHSYAIMLRGLSGGGRIGEAARMLDEMVRIGLTPDVHCYNAMLKGLCDMGLLDRAMSLYLEMSERNAYTHTILICEMCKRGMVEDAQEVFNQMEKLGCIPSVVTFNVLINGLCKADKLEEARLLFYKMEIGRNPSLFLSLSQGSAQVLDSTSLQKKIEQMCEAGQFLEAYKFLIQLADSGVVPDIITYNILINAFCEACNIHGAFTLLEDLQKKGVSPDSVTYGILVNGLYLDNRENDALKICERIQKAGFKPSIAFYRAVMTWLCRMSKVSLAFNLYLDYLKSLPSRHNDSISALEKYLVEGKLEQVIRGLLELDFKARDFDLAPYTILLIGFCQRISPFRNMAMNRETRCAF
uniref:Pentatricopeptide repeat-containing protein At1g79540 isoform X2 n=1 Tax=Cicer arietinum TaxID=3827 RepID=A0A3Q7XUZ9_CICAR|nr:pentatricopeptide repeat-containing protein At1g79540 isoform X2 [Cicer arietinum]